MFYIEKNGVIIGSVDGPCDEGDLAQRGEALIQSDTVIELGSIRENEQWVMPHSIELRAEISKLEAYLFETDWYAIRASEAGKAVPSDIVKKRREARDRISELRDSLARDIEEKE